MATTRIMSHGEASLQHLIRSHLQPTAAAATHLIKDAPAPLLPLPELRQLVRHHARQESAVSGMSINPAPVHFWLGLSAEPFTGRSRIAVHGRGSYMEDDGDNGDKDWIDDDFSDDDFPVDADDDDDDDYDDDDFGDEEGKYSDDEEGKYRRQGK